jgi:serine/threonine-protein kinase RsbW
MELKISSDPRWLRMVRAMMQEISRQAGFSEMERNEISLAVDETLSNVIKHAYRGNPEGPVWLSCASENGYLEVVVRDQGQAPDPKRLEPPPPDEIRLGGRGVFLIRSIMDEVEFEREGETNTVRLRKYVKTPAG